MKPAWCQSTRLTEQKKRYCQWQGERIREEERRFYAPSKTFFQFTTLNSRFSWSTSHVFGELYDQRMRNKDPRADLRRDHHHTTIRVKELASESWKRAGSLSRAVRLAFRPTHRRRLFQFYLLLFFFSALNPVIGIFASRHASRTESLMSYAGIEKVEAGSLTCCEDLNNATIWIEWRGSNVFKVPYVGLVKCLL